jgi:hypothetical protein
MDTIEKRVAIYTWAADGLLGLWFGYVVPTYVLDWSLYFPNLFDLFNLKHWSKFSAQSVSQALLAIAVLLMYYNFRRNVGKEIEIMRSLFSPSRTPQNWNRVHGAREVIYLTLVWVGVTMILSSAVRDIRLFASAVGAYAAINIVGIVLYRRNIFHYIQDERFSPAQGDEHASYIWDSRAVQVEYLNRRHHTKEVALFVASMVALALSSQHASSHWFGQQAPAVVLIFALLANEAIVSVWRFWRNEQLDRLSADQSFADASRAGD